VNRRDFFVSAVAALAWTGGAAASTRAGAAQGGRDRFSDVERRVGGRLGVVALDVHRDRRLAHRADERFPMCSTFKWLLAAQVLSRVERGEEQLDRPVPFGPRDLLDYAPVTRERVGEGAMSVSALCAAAVEYSDNTAANLLLATVGGPGGLTAYVRSLGDGVTRLDRSEPELNSATPGDPRDTTSPDGMATDLRRVLLGDALSAASRRRLVDWLAGNTTGGAKLRAGLPAGWRVGDKTGMGANGSTNDVAIAWPAPERPVLIAAFLTESAAPASERDGALAEVGRLVADWVAQ
jgi:beta-lactamase class A